MLYEEYKNGTGSESYVEYELAEKLYNAMPESFSKEKLYALRKAMDDSDFIALCKIVEDCNQKVQDVMHTYERYVNMANFLTNMVDTLKNFGKIDCIATYAAIASENVKKKESDRILGLWEDLQ